MIERSSSPPPCLLCACPGADVTNYHKPGDLKPHRFLILQSWRPRCRRGCAASAGESVCSPSAAPGRPCGPRPAAPLQSQHHSAFPSLPLFAPRSPGLLSDPDCLPALYFFFNFSFRTHFSFTRVVRMTQSSHIFFLTDFPILTSTITELRLSR